MSTGDPEMITKVFISWIVDDENLKIIDGIVLLGLDFIIISYIGSN